jgi:hypothetical protein
MADWEVPREGLINFKDPKVKEQGLTSGNEPTQIYLYTIDHPIHGRYLIDTGMADFFRKDPSEWPFSSAVRYAMNIEKLASIQAVVRAEIFI